jgi:ferritin-like metal-binding protein YciE
MCRRSADRKVEAADDGSFVDWLLRASQETSADVTMFRVQVQACGSVYASGQRRALIRPPGIFRLNCPLPLSKRNLIFSYALVASRSAQMTSNTRVDLGDSAQHPKKMEAIMAKEQKQLNELFHDTLKDIYFAEKKILATLPKMAKAAQSPDLKRAFEKHRAETEGHVSRLEKVFAAIDKKPQAKTCDAIVGITDEGAEIMKEYKGSPALDAGLLAAAQAVEHYEMSRYGTLKTWAQELGLNDAVRLLDQTLQEEKKTDAALTKIAEAVVNQQAEAA